MSLRYKFFPPSWQEGALHKKCRVTRIALRQAQGERCISIYVRGQPVEPRSRNATFGAKPQEGGQGDGRPPGADPHPVTTARGIQGCNRQRDGKGGEDLRDARRFRVREKWVLR